MRTDRARQLWFGIRFAAIATLLFGIYTFPYEESGRSERFFTQYLSGYACMAGAALSLIEPGVRVVGQDIVGRFSLRIVKSCDAMDAVILFVAAVCAFPVRWSDRAWGVVLGALSLVAVNVVRICSLYFVGIYHVRQFEVFHLEVWPLLMVCSASFGFLLWMSWACARADRERGSVI